MDTPPIYFASALMVAVIIIVLNSYVISLFYRKRNLRSFSNIILISLTLSDLMTGVVVIPFTVVAGMLNYLPFEDYAGLFIFSDIFIIFSATITIINLDCIVLDRYLSLCHPLCYSNTHKKSTIVKIVFLLWFLALFCSCIRLIWLAPIITHGISDTALLVGATYYDRIYSIVGFALYCVLCLLMLCAFCRMFCSIRKFRADRMRFLMNNKDSTPMKSEWKAVFIFGMMFLIFLACWTPMVTIRFLDDVGVITKPPSRVLLQTLVFIRFFSSVFDPILYTFYKLDFQLAVKEDKRALSAYLPSFYNIFARRRRFLHPVADVDDKGCVNSSFQSLQCRTKMTQNGSESSSKSVQSSHCENGVNLNAGSFVHGSPLNGDQLSIELPSSHMKSPTMLTGRDNIAIYSGKRSEEGLVQEDLRKTCNVSGERESSSFVVNNRHAQQLERLLGVAIDAESDSTSGNRSSMSHSASKCDNLDHDN